MLQSSWMPRAAWSAAGSSSSNKAPYRPAQQPDRVGRGGIPGICCTKTCSDKPDKRRDGSWCCQSIRKRSSPDSDRIGETEADIVVAVRGVVVVAIRHATVGRVVVPTAPAQHAVPACYAPCPLQIDYHALSFPTSGRTFYIYVYCICSVCDLYMHPGCHMHVTSLRRVSPIYRAFM